MAALAIRSLLRVMFGLGDKDRGPVSVDAIDDSLFGTRLWVELLFAEVNNRDKMFRLEVEFETWVVGLAVSVDSTTESSSPIEIVCSLGLELWLFWLFSPDATVLLLFIIHFRSKQ